MDGIVSIADGIIVIGRGGSLEEATKDHDLTVLNLRARLSQTRSSSKHPQHRSWATSSQPRDLSQARRSLQLLWTCLKPQDKAAACWFLRTITYLAKFCPNLSEVVRPLHDLTHLEQDFLWSEQHSKAFTQAKELVSKAPCLRYFDIKAPVLLQVDASEYG